MKHRSRSLFIDRRVAWLPRLLRWSLVCAVFFIAMVVATQLRVVHAEDQTADAYRSAATESQQNRVVVMTIRGSISRNLIEKVRSSIQSAKGDPVPAGFIVLIDSKGGDGMAAVKIGRLLREAKAHVFVTGECASACVYILASGVVRGASDYSVGIHRGRVTVSDDNAKVIREVDLDKEPAAAKQLAQFEQISAGYFAEMGLPPEFYQAMQAHKLKGVYRLSNEELIMYGLNGIEDRYYAERARFYGQQRGSYHMDKNEFHRRTLRVANTCAQFDRQQQAFVNCYKDVLKDPY